MPRDASYSRVEGMSSQGVQAIALRLVAALVVLLSPLCAAHAQSQVVIYRCTDASGHVTVQNGLRCPKDTREERKRIDVPPPMPVYRPAAPQPKPAPQIVPETVQDVAAAQTPEPAPAAPIPTPPPPLFACATPDRETYYSEAAEPPKRCIRMQTTGIGGNSGMGAGEACMVVSDQCAPVDDASLCEAWTSRVGEAEFRWKFAKPSDRDARKLEYERLRDLHAASTCVAPASGATP